MKKLFARNLTYLYTAVFCAGIQNIVTQMFFDRHYPERKETLMFVALFFGACFTVLGILASTSQAAGKSRHQLGKSFRRWVVTGLTAAVLVTFSGLFFVKSFLLYVLLFSIASFCINYLYNILDSFMTANVEPSLKEKNVRILLGYQLAGYVIAPLFFSYFVSLPWICIGFTLVAGLCSFLPAGTEYVARGITASDMGSVDEKVIRLSEDAQGDRQDRLAIMFSFFMYMGVYMFLPSIAYLLKDHLGIANYAVVSSYFLAGIVIVSALVILFGNAPKLWSFRILAPILMFLSLMILLLPTNGRPVTLILTALIGGSGYGVFLSGSRFFVNASAQEKNMVTRHNRMLTTASLMAYLFSAGLGFICEQGGITVVPVKCAFIQAFFVVAALIAVATQMMQKKEVLKKMRG